jgi:dimeric dUTPase (all-alpha-NTP-PPase superfamily)
MNNARLFSSLKLRMNINGGMNVDLEKQLTRQESLGTGIDLSKLFQMQKGLDAHIEKEHPRMVGEDRLAKKILALQVELGELANELPEIFKFWSNKKNNFEKALKEYIDCIHFGLSIGLDLGVKNLSVEYRSVNSWNTICSFGYVFSRVNKLQEAITFKKWNTEKDAYYRYLVAMKALALLGDKLGFTWEQVEQAYFEKNAVNHQRQKNGY